MNEKERYLLRDSPVFCMAPWTHMHVLTTGELFPCCNAAHKSSNAIGHLRRGDSLETAWNSEAMRALRKKMLSGEPSPLCERCYATEASGQRSWRTAENEKLAHHSDVVKDTDAQGRVPEVHLPFLDIRFSNICNLRCRICNPKLSSSWFKDGLAMTLVDPNQRAIVAATDKPDALWDEIVGLIPRAERFHFAGGEPLLMEEHYRIVDELMRRKMYDVELSYNTNLSRLHYKKHDVLKLWKPFRHVYVQASLDGMGERGDYMRKGQNWDEVVRNRERMLRECPHVDFCVLATVSVMNVLHLPDFYKEWVEKRYVTPSGFRINILFEPELFNVRGLPLSFKERVREKYVDFIENYLSDFGEEGTGARAEFGSVLSYMFAEQWDRLEEFRQYTKDLDVLRGERFNDIFPELAELVEPSPFVDDVQSARSNRKFGHAGRALRDLDRAIEGLSDSPLPADAPDPSFPHHSTLARAYMERGLLKQELGEEDGAQVDISRALALEPSLEIDEAEPGEYAQRALRKRARGDLEGALEDLTRATELAPTIALRRISESVAAARGGAVHLFPGPPKREQDVFSTLAFACYLRGVAKSQLGDRDGAVADFRAALEAGPSFPFVEHAKKRLIQS